MRCMKCMAEIADSVVCPECGYDQDTVQDNPHYLPPGTELNNQYIVGAVIGAGGFGVTYVGWDSSLERKVAIKEYFPSSLSTRTPGQTFITAFSGEKQQIFNHGKERFFEEARMLMQFAGEDGIVSVYDVFEANGTAYMVMEFVEGVTLKQSIAQFGKLKEQHLLDWVIPLLLSLKFVHNAGVIHRDISPDNILCLPDGSAKLLDFGSARYAVMEESKSLSVIVKQGFTPVEQYQSHGKQGPFTDIYAIGASMYQALTGVMPEESLERLSKDSLKRPSQLGAEVSEQTENAILTAMNVRPEDRPQDIDEFLAIFTGEKAGNVVTKKRSKKGLYIAIAAVAAVAIGAGALAAALLNRGETPDVVTAEGITVPNAINMHVDKARGLFEENQLHMLISGGRLYDRELISQGYIEEDYVVSQDPGGGEAAEPEDTVGVELSKGKAQNYVPPVEDMLADAAQGLFEQAGFGDDFEVIIQEEYSDTNMPGTVISQSVPENSPVDFDGVITLTVSLGREEPMDTGTTFSAEDYTGRDFHELKEELLADGIYLVRAHSMHSNDYPAGAVLAQAPQPGEDIYSGGAVYVITSLGSEQTWVPDVRYTPLEEAKAALMESGLSWKISYIVDPTVAAGLVAEQGIEPGTRIPFASEIELFVSAEEPGSETVEKLDISLTPDTLALFSGETAVISCSYTGGEKVVWASSNSRIAQVDGQGNVTAVSFGSVTITAAVNGNVALATVTVEDDTVLTSMRKETLSVGETLDLGVDLPEELLSQVIWGSSSPHVAPVDEHGVVTALEPGHTSITAAYDHCIMDWGVQVDGGEEITYITIPRSSLLGQITAAERVLREKGVRYQVVEEYSSTTPQGAVIKLQYTGYSDRDSFYIAEGTPVTLRGSKGENAVVSVTIKTPPIKTSYPVGAVPDYSGMALAVTYADGSTKEVTRGYTAPNTPLSTVGKQKVTVSYEGQTATLELTVEPIQVAAVSVSPAAVTCKVGESVTLTVKISPANASDQTVTVTSSDPSVVKADGTHLSALKAGTATITVKSANGKTAASTVTVQQEEQEKQEEKEPTLTVKRGPATTQYYIGDTVRTAGLVLTYTDRQGIVSEITAGFDLQCDTGSAGVKKASVTYQGVTATFEVTVKTPSVEIMEYTTANQSTLSVVTDPPNATVTMSSSNPSIFYLSGSTIVPVSSGTADIIATMVYNGKTYQDRYPFTVQMEPAYGFTVQKAFGQEGSAGLKVVTDIPGFDHTKVAWTASRTDVQLRTGDQNADAHVFVDYSNVTGPATFTVTARYTYNGKQYSNSYQITVEGKTYDFSIVPENVIYINDGTVPLAVYSINTDIPGFTMSNVRWSVSGATGGPFADPDSRRGIEAGECGVDHSTVASGGTYTVNAEYTHNGKVYRDSYSYTVKEVTYSFSIYETHTPALEAFALAIDTDIPNFDPDAVQWSISNNNFKLERSGDGILVSAQATGLVTVTATYVHNGKEYFAGFDYGFYETRMIRDSSSVDGERGIYRISTELPGFDPANVKWSVDGASGWVEGSSYIVDEAGLSPGSTYTVHAILTHRGKDFPYEYTYKTNPFPSR